MVITTADVSFLLVHSPFVAPSTWDGVALVLAASGYSVTAPALSAALECDGRYYETMAGAAIAALPADTSPIVVVGHGAAGSIVPKVFEMLIDAEFAVEGAMFVDANLPHPGRSWLDTAADQHAFDIRALAVDDQLPPWHEWTPNRSLVELLPDFSTRQEFLAGMPNLPLAFLEEVAPFTRHWPPRHLAYIHLGDDYHAEVAEASRLGWTTLRNQLDHLAPVTRPNEVVELMLEVIRAF